MDFGLNGCSPLGDFPAPFGPINFVFKQATREERQLRGWWGWRSGGGGDGGYRKECKVLGSLLMMMMMK